MDFAYETISAVQWSHDESVLPEEVKAAIENRQAGDQRQALLPDAAANQQQVRAKHIDFVMHHPASCLLCKP